MSRGRVQLAAVGVQDQFLTGEPQVTYFLKNFKRHTPFALETLQSGFTSQPQFGIANDCFIPRKGDLIRNMYVKVNLSDFGYANTTTTIVGTTTSSTISVADASGITVGAYFAGDQGGGSYSFDNDSITVTAVNNVGSESYNVTLTDSNRIFYLYDPPSTYQEIAVAAGTYTSGADLATAVQTVISGLYGGSTCTYSGRKLSIQLNGAPSDSYFVFFKVTTGSPPAGVSATGFNNDSYLVFKGIPTTNGYTNPLNAFGALGDSDPHVSVTPLDVTTNTVTLSQEVDVVDGKPAIFLDPVGYTDSIGHALIEHADLLIGGQTVERITGEYLELYSEIAVSDSQQEGMELLVGKTLSKTGLGPASSQGGITKTFYGAYPRIFMIPLPFYFFRNDSLSIPLSALTKQEVQVNVKFRKWEDLIVNMNASGKTISDLSSQPQMLELTLVTEYVFLSDAELNHFRISKIDYVISQLQLARFNMAENTLSKQVALKFLNPVKELYFVIQNSEFVESDISTGNDWFNYNNLENLRAPLYEQLSNLKLDLNGETIIPSEVADAVYLRGIQPMLSHTRGPNRRFYVYSFALDPENHLPTGQVNMSRIINQILSINSTINTKQRDVRVYALNYNVLRIQNGLAGVIFNDNNLN